MTSIFEGQPPKTRPFSIKTRDIWVPGTYIYIYIFMQLYDHIVSTISSTAATWQAFHLLAMGAQCGVATLESLSAAISGAASTLDATVRVASPPCVVVIFIFISHGHHEQHMLVILSYTYYVSLWWWDEYHHHNDDDVFGGQFVFHMSVNIHAHHQHHPYNDPHHPHFPTIMISLWYIYIYIYIALFPFFFEKHIYTFFVLDLFILYKFPPKKNIQHTSES